MIEAVVYESHTGFTKQYAYRLALECGLPVYSLGEARRLKDKTSVVFLSWIKNGMVVNLKKVNRFTVMGVAAVGMIPYTEDYISELKENNKLESLFYLPGGLRYYKLTMWERHVMTVMRKRLEGKNKKEALSLTERELLLKLQNGSEYLDFDALSVLKEWISEEKDNIVC